MYGDWMKKINTNITIEDIDKYKQRKKMMKRRIREQRISKFKENVLAIKQKIAIVR